MNRVYKFPSFTAGSTSSGTVWWLTEVDPVLSIRYLGKFSYNSVSVINYPCGGIIFSVRKLSVQISK